MCNARGRVKEKRECVSVRCVIMLVIFTQSRQWKCSSPPIKKASAWACSSKSKSCHLQCFIGKLCIVENKTFCITKYAASEIQIPI